MKAMGPKSVKHKFRKMRKEESVEYDKMDAELMQKRLEEIRKKQEK